MTRKRRSFSPEFKQEAASLVLDQGYTIPRASVSLGIGESAIRRWFNQLAEERDGVTPKGKALTPEQRRIQELEARYAKFTRSGLNCALVMYDFDHFKSINDSYGHAMGDEVLKKAAIIVNDQLRPYDHAYRLGGEEFVILLSGLEIKGAYAFAERIRQSIEVACFELEDTSVWATISLGIAQFRQSDTTFDDALRRADEALYESKVHSGNTITLIE